MDTNVFSTLRVTHRWGIANLATAIANLNFMGFVCIAKLLVWSFLAGFAEALIPDAMCRLIEKAKLMKKS